MFNVVRSKEAGWFWIDNEIIDQYGKKIGDSGLLTYMALCRLSNNANQECYPSIRWLADQLGMSKTTVVKSVGILVKHELVQKSKDKGKATTYTLLSVPKSGTHKQGVPNSGLGVPKTGTEVYQNKESIKTNTKRLTKNTNVEAKASTEEYGNAEINQVIRHFEKRTGFKLKNVAWQRRYCTNLLRRYGFKQTIGAINFSSTLLGKDKTPQVYDLGDLWKKWDMLSVHAGKTVKKSKDQSDLVNTLEK